MDNLIIMVDSDPDDVISATLISQKFDEEYEKRLIQNQIDLIQKYNPHPQLHRKDINVRDQLIEAYMNNKRSEKHPNNLKQLLGGTHYESNNSSRRYDLSSSGKISI